jgi:hypothetical protein
MPSREKDRKELDTRNEFALRSGPRNDLLLSRFRQNETTEALKHNNESHVGFGVGMH